MNELIFGKDTTSNIVSVEVGDNTATLFRETAEGISTMVVPATHWILFTQQHSPKFRELSGTQPYKWLMEYDSRQRYNEVKQAARDKGLDTYSVRDQKEAFMIRSGVTYFKDTKLEDVSVLSFDLETTGIAHNKGSRVLLISNTFRRQGKIERRLFSLDEYETQAAMLEDWCTWVREKNPSILLGHGIYNFDFPYLQHCAKMSGAKLKLGRDGSAMASERYVSKFRKDGSQAYEYNNVHIYGREIVDTFFVAIKYDFKRVFPSYKLKDIIKYLGLERKGRQHYDASQIAKNWHDVEERKKIKGYAIDDADDSLKLYDKMIGSYFYYTRSVPRSFQQIINTATGSQINGMMVRAYLQNGHSIAKASEKKDFRGAISFGIPGIHKNVFKIDVASLYPSIILAWKIYDPEKDPLGLFLKLVDAFTTERLIYKKKGKETGDPYYIALEQALKILINSMFGFLAAMGLNYNSPAKADDVTRHGREILQEAIKWATGKTLAQTLPGSEDDHTGYEDVDDESSDDYAA